MNVGRNRFKVLSRLTDCFLGPKSHSGIQIKHHTHILFQHVQRKKKEVCFHAEIVLCSFHKV